MSIFNRRKKQQQQQQIIDDSYERMIAELSKPYCQQKGHKCEYRDFPPYIEYHWESDGRGSIEMKEKYVCLYCHKIETKILSIWKFTNCNLTEFNQAIDQTKKEYKNFIKPKAIVEDMVNDAIMVDRQKLEIWDNLHAPKEKDTGEIVI